MRLDAEAVARRYAQRPGCRFLGYQEVGLAVFAMNLRVVAIEVRSIPPLDEFLLRFLREGVSGIGDLSRLLGVEQTLIESRLVELRRTELIDVVAGDADCPVVLSLTRKGSEAAQQLQRSVVQEVTIPHVIVHGLLRIPVGMGDQARKQYLKPKEAKDLGLRLVPAIPSRYPTAEELDVKALDALNKEIGGKRKGECEKDIVAIKTVLSSVFTLYEPAVLLEYETSDSSREVQVGFAVAGRVREEYEISFEKVGGVRRCGDLLDKRSDPIEERVRQQVPPKLIRQLGSFADAEDLAARVEALRQEAEDKERDLRSEGRADTKVMLQKELEALQVRLKEVEAERDARKVKYLWTPDIRAKLQEALVIAKHRLLILSGWISSEVVNADFLGKLETAIKRGVRAWIGYGFDKDSLRGQEQRREPRWREAENGLRALAERHVGSLMVCDVGNSHEKRLICDNLFALGGSFNFLSFAGQQRGRRGVRHEGADLIENAEYCEELYQRYIKLFFSGTKQ